MIKKRTMDEVLHLCESRYELVNVISAKARDLADKAEEEHIILTEKPVNMVIANLLNGTSAVVEQDGVASVYSDGDFELTVSAAEDSEDF